MREKIEKIEDRERHDREEREREKVWGEKIDIEKKESR